MTEPSSPTGELAPIRLATGEADIEDLLGKEWLLANRLGAYASSTVVGCHTRRYHGLLVAAALPPTKRLVALSTLMEYLHTGGQAYELATNEFAGAFAPEGYALLREFRQDASVTMVYRAGEAELTKEILLAESANRLLVRYTLRGAAGTLVVWPFTPLRNYHEMRKVHQPHQMTFDLIADGVTVRERMYQEHAVCLTATPARFTPKPQWWYRFHYRVDIRRGQDGSEDLYTPGCFECELADGATLELTAGLDEVGYVDADQVRAARRARQVELADATGADDPATRRLAAATDAFVVSRSFPNASSSPTILAGYHWFADWGRDAFIALPGLLLCTKQYEQARGVFRTFSEHIRHGLVPNRFDDYSVSAHYNSVDASLWYILAAERYMAATDDRDFWLGVLQPSAHAILSAFQAGTEFDIQADADGLLTAGSPQTQLTWMDAALGEEVVTPRHGRAVEVNALWYCAHRIMAAWAEGELADQYAQRADAIQPAFVRTFWCEKEGHLFDCVTDLEADASLRPNQIFAVSLPYSPLDAAKQAAVVQKVSEHLLTPRGLRTLSPFDPRYRRRYGGSWESRDRAYHQGTVWAWLIGPFIEAFLKVNEDRPLALQQARQMLRGFDDHLQEEALGQISEIFDGEPPHAPRGCVAQAWSVAEVLRAKLLVQQKLREAT